MSEAFLFFLTPIIGRSYASSVLMSAVLGVKGKESRATTKSKFLFPEKGGENENR